MFGLFVAVLALTESTTISAQNMLIDIAGAGDFNILAEFFDEQGLDAAEVLRCISKAHRTFGKDKICLTVPLEELAGIPDKAKSENSKFLNVMDDLEVEQGQQCQRFTGDFVEFNNRKTFDQLAKNIEKGRGIRFTQDGKTVKLRKNRSLAKRGEGLALCWAALTVLGIYAGLVAMLVIGALVLSGTAVGTLSHGGAIALVVVSAVFLSGGFTIHVGR